jgi:hypothetical protein
MNISFKMLHDAMRNLPTPTRQGETYGLRVERRIDDLRRSITLPVDDSGAELVDKLISYDVVTLVAERYCLSQNNCWLEWELKI